MNLLLSIVDWIGTYIVFLPFIALGFVVLAAILSDLGVKFNRYIEVLSYVVVGIVIMTVVLMLLTAFAEVYHYPS